MMRKKPATPQQIHYIQLLLEEQYRQVLDKDVNFLEELSELSDEHAKHGILALRKNLGVNVPGEEEADWEILEEVAVYDG